jgi:hypothetical protein
VAPMSDTLSACRKERFRGHMASSSRDRISVDLRGFKAALVARAREQSVSPSEFVRSSLAAALGPTGVELASGTAPTTDTGKCVRISLRMQRDDAEALRRAAHWAGLSVGDLVAALVSKVPALGADDGPCACVSALTQSCDELAVLSRSLRSLATLLRQGSTRAAQEYRQMLDALDVDVRAHLALASSVVAEVRPFIRIRQRHDSPPAA